MPEEIEKFTPDISGYDWKPGDPIVYTRDKAPEFKLSRISGKQYDVKVPDTLDLADRAHLSLNVLTGAMDPDNDYEQYFTVFFNYDPPLMAHDFSDICDIKFLESIPLMRTITGSDINEHVEKGRLEARLKMVGDDGILWDPKIGRPWFIRGISAMNHSEYCPPGDHVFVPSQAGRFLGLMALQYIITGNDLWLNTGKNLADAFERLTKYRDDFAYIPVWLYGSDITAGDNVEMPTGMDSMNMEWIIQGMVQFYRYTGYEPAKELAHKYSKYFAYHGRYYGPNAEFISEHPHHHCHVLGLLAMAECAILTGDKDLLEFTRKGYEHGRSLGSPIIGYFPEVYDKLVWTCELCEVADMVGLALKLSMAGAGDYWDDVDRYVRNHFTEGQLTDASWIYRFKEGKESGPEHPWTTTDRVIERNIGAFAGWTTANEWYGRDDQKKRAIMQCCTGNGTRAIYYAWKNILQFDEGKLRVNLLLNRASKWADVDSYVPYEGRVDIRIKTDCDLDVRIPEWVKPEESACTVNGAKVSLSFDGRYAQIGQVRQSDTVTLTFPIFEREMKDTIGGRDYTLQIKGNDVVSIDPRGKISPLYEREFYLRDKPNWVNKTRFVPDIEIDW